MPRRPPDPYHGPWINVRLSILARDKYRCWKCGERATTVDHIVPLSEAPHLRLEASNLRASCAKHNYGRVTGRLAAMAKLNRSTAPVRKW